LKKCVEKIAGRHVASTDLWLVSAEILNGSQFDGNGIPQTLLGNSKSWATDLKIKPIPNENCFLFLFACTNKDRNKDQRQWAEEGLSVKRRRLSCKNLDVCQVSQSSIKIFRVISDFRVINDPNWI